MKKRRIFRLLILAAVLGGAIYFAVGCKLEHLEIRPGSFYSADEIERRLFTKGTDKYAYLFATRINRFWHEQIPFVEKVDVELVDKNSVIVYVYDKAVIGCVEHMGSYVYFDREGIAVDSTVSRREGIPLVTGLGFSEITMGDRLDLSDSTAFKTILNILLLLEKNGLTATDIDFGLRKDVTVHIDGNEFLLGTKGDYDVKINNIPQALAAMDDGKYRFDFKNYDNEHREIDVRRLQ